MLNKLFFTFLFCVLFSVSLERAYADNDLTPDKYLTVEKIEVQTVVIKQVDDRELKKYMIQAIYYRWYERIGWYAVEYELLRGTDRFNTFSRNGWHYLFFIDRNGNERRVKSREKIWFNTDTVDHERESYRKYPHLFRVPYFSKYNQYEFNHFEGTYNYLLEKEIIK